MATGDTPRPDNLPVPTLIARALAHHARPQDVAESLPGADQSTAPIFGLDPLQLAVMLDAIYRRAPFRQFIYTAPAWTAGTGVVASIPALQADPDRCYLLIQNLDVANPIYFGADFSPWPTNPGIVIPASPVNID